MEQENYELLLQRLEQQDKRLEQMERRCNDIIAMNNTLYNTKEAVKPKDNKETLWKRLKEGLRYGV